MKKRNRIFSWIGIGLILLSVISLTILNIPTMKEQVFTFSSVYGEKTDVLEASYYEVEGASYAVLICPGYSCDRQKWRPMADLFVGNGLTTMVFDYSGQGASYGAIGFDNAKTDHVPTQIYNALMVLHERSGIPYENIILMGHSMGGRAILKLLSNDWFTLPVGNIILFSPEVDYEYSAQASLFAGTHDFQEEPWKSYHEGYTSGHNIYLYGSTGDDIVSVGSVRELYRHLGGNPDLAGTGKIMPAVTQMNGAGSRIILGIAGGILHSYEMYSATFAGFVNAALSAITGTASHYPAWGISTVYFGWLIGLAGVFLVLFGLNGKEAGTIQNESIPVLFDGKRFLLRKLLLWIPGLLMAFMICSITVVMPFGSPVMNSIYMCAIAGYGIVMLLAYRKGRFPGTEGRLPGITFRIQGRDWIRGSIIALLLCLYVAYALRSGMYRLLPHNLRLFWLMFATVLMTIGYYVAGCEQDMLDAAGASKKVKILYNLIQYVALFLLVLFYLIIKSYSGLIGQVQNMVLMYVFCIPLGGYIRRRTGNRLYGALICAFTFQAMMITSAALISMF